MDLSKCLNEGVNNLITWRNRYSKTEYPEKVVINIFYGKYTLEFMFPEILGCYELNSLGKSKVKWNEINEGFQKLKMFYGTTAVSKTQPVLLSLLTNITRNVANTNYGIYKSLITEAQNGNNAKLEEIEYAYLYYKLTDECVLLWGAFGGTGLTKIEAIGKMSGLIIDIEEIKTYGQIEHVLGQLCAAEYLKEHYKALQSNI